MKTTLRDGLLRAAIRLTVLFLVFWSFSSALLFFFLESRSFRKTIPWEKFERSVSPCVLEIRMLAASLEGKGEKERFPEELDALFRRRTRQIPPGDCPFHVFFSTDPEDWLPPYGTRTNIVVVVQNKDGVKRSWRSWRGSVEGGVSRKNGIVLSVPTWKNLRELSSFPGWKSYVCYWPKDPGDDGPFDFWKLDAGSPLWNESVRLEYGSDKLLLPPDKCWPDM